MDSCQYQPFFQCHEKYVEGPSHYFLGKALGVVPVSQTPMVSLCCRVATVFPFFFFFFFKILFIYLREDTQEREREREAETKAKGEAGSMQGARCGTPGLQDHALG